MQSLANRFHATAGIELKPWVFSLGWGLDSAPNFQNYIVSAGIDLFKVMEKLDIIPTPYHAPRAGVFPKVNYLSDEGLARPLVKEWVSKGPSIDPIDIGLNIPKKVQNKVKDVGKGVYNAVKTGLTPEAKANAKKTEKTP